MNAQVLLLGVWVRRPFLPLPPEWDLCSLRWGTSHLCNLDSQLMGYHCF